MGVEYFVEKLRVGAVTLFEDGGLSTDFRYARENARMRVRQIVDDDGGVAGFYERDGGVRSDVAEASSQEDFMSFHSLTSKLL